MNRGRRRGGMGLSGLRDGVKRRLFDPNIVPHKPDARETIGRLAPIISAQLRPRSLLMGAKELAELEDELSLMSRKRDADDEAAVLHQTHLLKLHSLLEYAFEHAPHYHRAPARIEGIQIDHSQKDTSSSGRFRRMNSISAIHLLLMHEEIDLWAGGALLKGLRDPLEWYPPELAQLLTTFEGSRKKKRKPLSNSRPRMPDRSLDDLISDQVITDATEEAEMVGDDEGLGQETHSLAIGDGDGDRSSTDTEDARWNGEAGELGPDADDEELDNDYCQAYFDNGEGDFSDDGLGGYTVGGEDGGGGRGDQGDYYE